MQKKVYSFIFVCYEIPVNLYIYMCVLRVKQIQGKGKCVSNNVKSVCKDLYRNILFPGLGPTTSGSLTSQESPFSSLNDLR